MTLGLRMVVGLVALVGMGIAMVDLEVVVMVVPVVIGRLRPMVVGAVLMEDMVEANLAAMEYTVAVVL